MIQTYTFTSVDYVVGNINSSGGWTSQSNRIRPNDFIVKDNIKGITINFTTTGADLQACISCCNSSGSLIQEYYWHESPYTCTPPSATAKISVEFRKSNDTDLLPSDLDELHIEITLPGQWYIDDDDNLTNTDFIDLPQDPFIGESPYRMWRIRDDLNSGMPFSPLFIDLQQLPMHIVPSRPLIHVYGSQATTYDDNGYAIIEPITARIRQEENGMYEATFETYLDKYNKYTYLRKQAQVKIPMRYHGETVYQIFRIRQVNRKMDSSGNYRITATAQHKWYDIARYMIKDCRPTQLSGTGALVWLMTHGWYDNQHQTQEFDYSSNISLVSTAYYENTNVASALLGVDQCFVNRWGGKLYRDNNYFSINSSMENAQTSGVIEYSYNMTEIDWQEDDSALITVLIAKDNFGNEWRITNPDVPNENIPHHIYGYAYFNYDTEDVIQFHRDAQAYYDDHKQADLHITIQFANLADLEMYKDFLALDDFEVGDKVVIYHAPLGIYYSNLEIISKEFDVVAQKTIQIELGNFKNAITRRPYLSETVTTIPSPTDKAIAAVQNEQYETNTKIMATSINGMEQFPIFEIEKRTIAQLQGD